MTTAKETPVWKLIKEAIESFGGKNTNIARSNPAAEKGFARDVTTIGHFGTGNLELTLTSKTDIEKARHLIEQSYEAN